MVGAINKHLIPLGVKIPQTDREVAGGYFIWLTLPSPLKGAVVAQRAKEEENLAVAKGEMFEVSPLRRCYGLTTHRPRFPATPIIKARLS
jgi:DNA-binding transcriptional MocR family regulator